MPILERQPCQAIRNNILGTKNVVDSAKQHNCERFVLISTDKAVNPTNILGASKRIAEIYTYIQSKNSDTRFITVRFGNVLDSVGSVVPLFNEQIKSGGPVTVTDPEITRYFMTIPEACQLIMQSSAMGKGGEIFVLDMGKPVKINFLAEQMIILSGLKPGKDIQIEYTGLRPGEKMYEELFYKEETRELTSHEKIFNARHAELNSSEIIGMIELLIENHENGDHYAARALMDEILSITDHSTGNIISIKDSKYL